MKVRSCTCKQCKAKKHSTRSSVRRYYKRQTSKWRRKAKKGEVLNFYWA